VTFTPAAFEARARLVVPLSEGRHLVVGFVDRKLALVRIDAAARPDATFATNGLKVRSIPADEVVFDGATRRLVGLYRFESKPTVFRTGEDGEPDPAFGASGRRDITGGPEVLALQHVAGLPAGTLAVGFVAKVAL